MVTRHWSGPWRSTEQVRLEQGLLSGRVQGQLDQEPFALRYQIQCDPHWRTRQVSVSHDNGSQVHMEVDKCGHWFEGGERLTELDGCLDVDLGFTPATNLLPLRRCPLEVGESVLVLAAWLTFPEWRWQPLAQLYTRLSLDRYHCQILGGDFEAELVVDENGLVLRYGDIWNTLPLP